MANWPGHRFSQSADTPARGVCWARRLKRVFGIEIEDCARCRGNLKIIASIEEPEVIAKAGAGARHAPRTLFETLVLYALDRNCEFVCRCSGGLDQATRSADVEHRAWRGRRHCRMKIKAGFARHAREV